MSRLVSRLAGLLFWPCLRLCRLPMPLALRAPLHRVLGVLLRWHYQLAAPHRRQS